MKVSYDRAADALYVSLNDERPEGVVEVRDEVNLDVTADGRIIGIEILDASRKIDLKTLLSYNLDEETVQSIS